MDMQKKHALEKVQNWFNNASNWQKDLFCTIWTQSANTDQIIDRAIKLAGQEHLSDPCRIVPKTGFPEELTFSDTGKPPVTLKEVSNVTGVGALAMAAPLQFGEGLTVVYGENGCGKSSYVRILKALENHTNAPKVLGNIFEEKPLPAKATVLFSVDGTDFPALWTQTCKKNFPLQIYDTASATQFVDKENEVVYEPRALSVISQLADIYAEVSSYYKKKSQELQTHLLPLPKDLSDHPVVAEYTGLKTPRQVELFAKKYHWDQNCETELNSIVESLKEQNPLSAVANWESKKNIIKAHGRTIFKLLKYVNSQACKTYITKQKEQIETKKTQDAMIAASKKHSLLDHFGSDEWQKMWVHANEYISIINNTRSNIPTSQTGKCALCQQDLNEEALSRMQFFNEFYVSDAITKATHASEDFKQAVRILQTEIENKINLSEIDDSLTSSLIPVDIQTTIMAFYRGIWARCEWLLEYDPENPAPCPELPDDDSIVEIFKDLINKTDVYIATLKATAANYQQQVSRKNELVIIKWATSNLPLKLELIKMSTLLSDCKTNAVTTLKKDVSRLLITDTYISRFKEEMLALDEKGQIKVQLVEAASKHGKTYHQVSLRGAKSVGNHKNGEILSEGEFRVVSLAAFLADLSAWGRVMPFVFDDPITSLDHKFEARVAARLVRLSTDRQVIVFTHRLHFAHLLEHCHTEFNAAAALSNNPVRATITHIELRNSPLGQPASPNYLQRITMLKALNEMIGQDCAKIRKFQKEGEYDIADNMLQALASKFRNLIEQGIERELLSGIVSRFDYRVFSQKLPYLFALTAEDVALFHKMMSKYSCYDHSHSIEASAPTPNVDDLEKDLDKMRTWAKDYKNRRENARDKADGNV